MCPSGYTGIVYNVQELIQNAEDAGATEVKFLYDKRTYGRDPRYLQHPELGHFQVWVLHQVEFQVVSEWT